MCPRPACSVQTGSNDSSAAIGLWQGLAAPMLRSAAERVMGCCPTQPVLVCGESGAGKTWACTQLVHELASRCKRVDSKTTPLVPALVQVQRLARMLQERPIEAALSPSLLLQYFVLEHRERVEWLMLLAQAYQMRTLLVVIDGLDEAAGRTESVVRLVREVLIPEGFHLVCTATLSGADLGTIAPSCLVYDLEPLDDEVRAAPRPLLVRFTVPCFRLHHHALPSSAPTSLGCPTPGLSRYSKQQRSHSSQPRPTALSSGRSSMPSQRSARSTTAFTCTRRFRRRQIVRPSRASTCPTR